MDLKEIKGIPNYIYDNKEEFSALRPNAMVSGYWRNGNTGEWVETDDGYVCQILKKFSVKDHKGIQNVMCVRTVCGTYKIKDKKRRMLGEDGVAENIYSFSGTNISKQQYRENGKSGKQMLFARYIATGMDTKEAFHKVYPKARSKRYIDGKVNNLLKSEKVQTMINDERKSMLNELGVTNEWIVERYRDMVELAERPSDVLRSLDSLAKIAGLFDTDTKSEKLTVWAGFTPEQMESLKNGNTKTELIGHSEEKS